jgi:hypothetical protein
LDERGRTVQYRYRRSSAEGKPLFSGDCVVPYTEAALRRLDRRFGVRTGGGADQFRDRQEQSTVQGCVGDGMCMLEPIYVTPPPSDCGTPGCPGYEGDGDNYGGGGSGGGTGGWGGGSGGNDGEPLIPTEEETDGNCPQCGEKPPSAKQDSAIRDAIEKVPCASMKSVLQERLPYLQVFTQQPAHLQGTGRADLGYHANGVIYVYEGLWKNDASGNPTILRSPAQLIQVLVHEAAHAYWSYYMQYFNGSTTHHDRWKETMAECGY